MNYGSVREIKKLLQEYGLAPLKSLGQNFLIDENIRNKICGEVPAEGKPVIWEIGPGLGSLTEKLLERAKPDMKITAFELDHGFCKVLRDNFTKDERFSLSEGNFLENYKSRLAENPGLIFGNLPYNVGSVMIVEILKSDLAPKKMVFMLQKEVAERIEAPSGSPKFSAFSLFCGLEWKTKVLFRVSPGSFYPNPEVNSSVIKFTRVNNYPKKIKTEYFALADDLFAARRKTIKNNLKRSRMAKLHGLVELENAFLKNDIDISKRAETLRADQLISVITLLSRELS